jgi:hypothetical protein
MPASSAHLESIEAFTCRHILGHGCNLQRHEPLQVALRAFDRAVQPKRHQVSHKLFEAVEQATLLLLDGGVCRRPV